MRQQFGVLQERQAYLNTLNETLQSRLDELAEPAPTLTPSNDADVAVTPRGMMTLIDPAIFDNDNNVDSNPMSTTTTPMQDYSDCQGALSTLTALLLKLCIQVNHFNFYSHHFII